MTLATTAQYRTVLNAHELGCFAWTAHLEHKRSLLSAIRCWFFGLRRIGKGPDRKRAQAKHHRQRHPADGYYIHVISYTGDCLLACTYCLSSFA
ncbi:MAG TPA: hypothetical protein VGQ96_03945 [Candidatus Eremiobacteraceae bacterium]|nr:hypothetical protein [Candidatus Eremiobacteraceae bacterium]